MNRPYFPSGSRMAAALGAAFLCTGTLHGAMVAEWQFNGTEDLDAADNVTVNIPLSYAAPGSSTQSTITPGQTTAGVTMYKAGSTGISSNWAPYLQTGYFSQPTGGNNPSPAGGLSTSSDDSGHRYTDYMGFNGLGGGTYDSGPDAGKTKGGTLYMVIRPNASWNDNKGSYGLFGSGNETIVLSKESGDILQLKVAGVTTSISKPEDGWKTDTFYFVAASWRNNADLILFAREMSDDGPLASPAGVTAPLVALGSANKPSSEPFWIGTRSTQAGTPRSRGGGDFAYVRIDNVYSSVDDMNAVFNGMVVAEPATVGMLGLMGVPMLLRRRRSL